MKNRKLPFGYALHGGEIVINQCEANAVGDIFRLYTGGTSLSGITEMLKSSEISYDAADYGTKIWYPEFLGIGGTLKVLSIPKSYLRVYSVPRVPCAPKKLRPQIKAKLKD